MLLVANQTHLIHDLLIVSVISQIFRSSGSFKEFFEADLWGLVLRREQGNIVLVVTYNMLNIRLT